MQDNEKERSEGQDSGAAEASTSCEKTGPNTSKNMSGQQKGLPFGAGVFEDAAPEPVGMDEADRDALGEEQKPVEGPLDEDENNGEEKEEDDTEEQVLRQYIIDDEDDETEEEDFTKILPGPTEEVRFGPDYRRRSPRRRKTAQQKAPATSSNNLVLVAVLAAAAIILLVIAAIFLF